MADSIGYIALADPSDPTAGLPADETVKLWVSPDMVVGLDDSKDESVGWDWIADGYTVMRTSPGQHDGHPATTMTLADSDSGREVGRMVLRNDALRDARLEVTRQFQTKAARDAFVRSLELGGTDEVKTIELDVSYGNEPPYTETLLDALMQMTKDTGISYRVVNPHGPGGGNPVVAFTGTDRELRKMLVDQYGAGDGSGESVSFYMGDDD
jgi:hypothetical protein